MSFDLITIGGGLGDAALARAMALYGARVLVIERAVQFRDRVRGEALHPWGFAEARALGIDTLLRAAGGREIRWWHSRGRGDGRVTERDLLATTPHVTGELTVDHRAMQELLLAAAAEAGACVRRGTTVARPGSRRTTERHGARRHRAAGNAARPAGGRGRRPGLAHARLGQHYASGMRHEDSLRSLELLGREVLPRLQSGLSADARGERLRRR